MKSRRIIALAAAALLIVFVCGGGYFGYKFFKHEQRQDQQLAALQKQISLLSAKVEDNSPAAAFTSSISDAYDYLAIGNSITLHPVTDFWWSEDGMAASKPELDYYHRVIEGLETEYGEINSIAYNYNVWEVQSHDRTETYEFLDQWLCPGIDLVTVQLSENCADVSTFSVDFTSLLLHIREKTGGAEIIVIDDFWSYEKHAMKKAVCEKLDVHFVDLSDIQGVDAFKAGMGAIVLGDDGEEHKVEHSGVANHPGDIGMAVIAERILEKIDEKKVN